MKIFTNPNIPIQGPSKTLKSKYLFFLNMLYVKHIQNKDKKYIRLHNKILRSLFTTRHSKDMIFNLEAGGIINIDTEYHRGQHSMGYQISKEYRTQKWEFKEYPIKETLIKKYRKNLDIESNQVTNINYLECLRWFRECDISQLNDAHPINLMTIDNHIFSTYSAKTGRYYYNFVNMPKEDRKKITYNGTYIKEVDIKSSQVLFLTMLLLRELGNESDILEFQSIVENQDIYLFLQKEISELQKMSREDIKKDLFAGYIFAKPKKTRGYYIEFFQKKFPSIDKYLYNYKITHNEHLSLKLSRLEGYFINEVLTEFNLINNYSNFNLILHDGIYVADEIDKMEIQYILKKNANQFGINMRFSN